MNHHVPPGRKHAKGNLRGLREYIKGRQGNYIKTIILGVNGMPRYICKHCKSEIGNQHTVVERQKSLYAALRKLLSILSAWHEDAQTTGITLKLCAKWPGTKPDGSPWPLTRNSCTHLLSPSIAGESLEFSGAFDVVHGQKRLRRAPVVTALYISPALSWSLATLSIDWTRRSFPRLQHIDVELFMGRTRPLQHGRGYRHALLMADRIRSVRSLSLTQYVIRNKFRSEAHYQSCSEHANGSAGVVRMAASVSFDLIELGIADVVHARDFFSYFNSLASSGQELPSSTLVHLVLTCRLDQLLVSPMEVEDLLLMASQAAA